MSEKSLFLWWIASFCIWYSESPGVCWLINWGWTARTVGFRISLVTIGQYLWSRPVTLPKFSFLLLIKYFTEFWTFLCITLPKSSALFLWKYEGKRSSFFSLLPPSSPNSAFNFFCDKFFSYRRLSFLIFSLYSSGSNISMKVLSRSCGLFAVSFGSSPARSRPYCSRVLRAILFASPEIRCFECFNNWSCDLCLLSIVLISTPSSVCCEELVLSFLFLLKVDCVKSPIWLTLFKAFNFLSVFLISFYIFSSSYY